MFCEYENSILEKKLGTAKTDQLDYRGIQTRLEGVEDDLFRALHSFSSYMFLFPLYHICCIISEYCMICCLLYFDSMQLGTYACLIYYIFRALDACCNLQLYYEDVFCSPERDLYIKNRFRIERVKTALEQSQKRQKTRIVLESCQNRAETKVT